MIKPMLLTDWEAPRDMVFPGYAQPKLNGVRALYDPAIGFYTRQHKLWKPEVLAHIKPPASAHVLDGELYCHGMSRQEINARVAVNRIEAHPDAAAITYHIFDVVNTAKAFRHRNEALGKLSGGEYWTIVETKYCKCRDIFFAFYKAWLATGYEGAVIRHCESPYECGVRSPWTVRRKPVYREWFRVTAGYDGRGEKAGMLGGFIVELRNGNTNAVGSGLNDPQRRAFREAKPRWVLIEYRGLSLDDKLVEPVIVDNSFEEEMPQLVAVEEVA